MPNPPLTTVEFRKWTVRITNWGRPANFLRRIGQHLSPTAGELHPHHQCCGSWRLLSGSRIRILNIKVYRYRYLIILNIKFFFLTLFIQNLLIYISKNVTMQHYPPPLSLYFPRKSLELFEKICLINSYYFSRFSDRCMSCCMVTYCPPLSPCFVYCVTSHVVPYCTHRSNITFYTVHL